MSYLSILIAILPFRESKFNDLEDNEDTDTGSHPRPKTHIQHPHRQHCKQGIQNTFHSQNALLDQVGQT